MKITYVAEFDGPAWSSMTPEEQADWIEEGTLALNDVAHVTSVSTGKVYTLAELDGTDDSADWVHVGYVLDADDVEWLRSRTILT